MEIHVTLDDDQYETLLCMMGYAIGAAWRNGDKKSAFRFVRLGNKLHENDPDWTLYQLPIAEIERIEREET